MRTFKSVLKRKETLFGILAAMMFQLIFVVVWLTGYDGVYERTNQFKVGIVNEDSKAGKKIVTALQKSDLFKLSQMDHLDEAKKELDQRNINMLIYLPEYLTENLLAGENVSIEYYINHSSPMLTKQIMEKAATEINTNINDQIQQTFDKQLSMEIPEKLLSLLENDHILTELLNETLITMQAKNKQTKLQQKIITTNTNEKFTATLLPLLIVLASYISAMLISQHLQLAVGKLNHQKKRISLFVSRQMINILVAIILSLLTICLIFLFKMGSGQSFLLLWGFQTLLMFSFLALSQIFVMLFGNIGMVFNIALTAIQLVSSGAIVSRELLSPFYNSLGKLLPATYGVNSYLSFVFGGGNVVKDTKSLVIIICILLIIAIGVQGIRFVVEKYRLNATTKI